jgi:hypothetical protein
LYIEILALNDFTKITDTICKLKSLKNLHIKYEKDQYLVDNRNLNISKLLSRKYDYFCIEKSH